MPYVRMFFGGAEGEDKMYADIYASGNTVKITLSSDYATSDVIRLLGASCFIAPIGPVNALTVQFSEGNHAILLNCYAQGDSGSLPFWSSCVILAWQEEDGKRFAKSDENAQASELSRFNPFVRSEGHVYVVDSAKRIAYASSIPTASCDASTTWKIVTDDDIAAYIAKRLTLEQLDERATEVARMHSELEDGAPSIE